MFRFVVRGRWFAYLSFLGLLLFSVPGCAGNGGDEAPVEAAAEAPLVEIPKVRRPLPGLLTGGQPTPEQFEQARELGYRTIVNLRTEGEAGFAWEADKLAELGLRYVLIPVAGADGLTRENVDRLAEVLEDPDAGLTMVHCRSGNRVGALLALRAAWRDGAPAEEALALGLEGGLTKLEPEVRGLLGLAE